MLFLATNCLTISCLIIQHLSQITLQFAGMSFAVVTLAGFTNLITILSKIAQ